MRAIAFKVAEVIGSDLGAANVNYNWMEPARTVRISVDQDQARLLGLSSQQLALSLNAVVSGVTATQVRSGIYLVDVLVRASAEQRMSLSTIRALQVPLRNGRTVPPSQIASVEYGQEYPIVSRRTAYPRSRFKPTSCPVSSPPRSCRTWRRSSRRCVPACRAGCGVQRNLFGLISIACDAVSCEATTSARKPTCVG